MLNSFPKIFAQRAIVLYFLILAAVSVLFSSYMLKFQWMLFGAAEVCLFFYYVSTLPVKWVKLKSTMFVKRLFWTAFIIRAVYVIFSYFYYLGMTGIPFEYSAADSFGYHDTALWIRELWASGNANYWYFVSQALSDSGYPSYLAVLYILTGHSIFIARIVKALLGAYTCVLIYKFSERNFGDSVARLAAIFCMVMPNLIYYCGLHLKEVEMTFLFVFFAERFDYVMRQQKMDWKAFILAIVLALLLFLFRTALGAVAIMSAMVAILFSSSRMVSWTRKLLIVIVGVSGIAVSMGDMIYQETMELWNNRGQQQVSMQWRSERKNGNAFAKYAGAAVFAPMIFTIPFPTMVEVPEQENQKMIHGGNYVKNITSALTILALIMLLYSGDWRKHVFLLALACGYLLVVAFSEFAQSERFHYPVLPLELMLAAYGVSILKNKHKKWFSGWLVLIFVANVAWAWFKLKGRGLV